MKASKPYSSNYGEMPTWKRRSAGRALVVLDLSRIPVHEERKGVPRWAPRPLEQ